MAETHPSSFLVFAKQIVACTFRSKTDFDRLSLLFTLETFEQGLLDASLLV